jgi:excisionase family DNA binding protein
MPGLSTIQLSHTRRARPGAPQPPQRTRRVHPTVAGPARFAIPNQPGERTPTDQHATAQRPFPRLIDAKAAGELLGVPHTWLLAQAREGWIPHQRLGHYVRFNPDDLQDWLKETRSMPHPSPSYRGRR